jgi:hypothetical protein
MGRKPDQQQITARGGVVTTRSKVMTFAGFGLVAAVGISGCGSSSDSNTDNSGSGSKAASSAGTPKEKVQAAFQNLEQSSSAGFTLKLDSSEADINKINAAQPKADKMSASDLKSFKQVVDGKVTMNVTAPDGKTFADVQKTATATSNENLLKDPKAFETAMKNSGSFAVSVVSGDSGLVEFATKDGVIYLRADAQKIADMAGQNLSSVSGSLGQLPPVIATPVQKALDGKWVSLDLVKTVQLLDKEGLLDQLPTEDGTAAGAAADPAKVTKLITDLQASYDADSVVTEADGGYQVSVPYEKTADAIQSDLVALVGKDGAADFRKELKQAPNDNLVFTVKVDGDKLTGVNVDLMQFMDKPVEGAKFAVDLAVDPEAGAVQVPSDATAIDIAGILNLIPADSLKGLANGQL